MLRFIAFCMLCAPAFGQNARLDELVGEGVFGVKWSDTLDAVKVRYPNGKGERAGQLEFWEVRDGRTIFEVKRRSFDTLSFAYLANQLVAISATFRGYCLDAPIALEKFLGPKDERTAAESIDDTDIGVWRGSAFEARIGFVGPFCTLEFKPTTFKPAEATRQQLGLE